MTSASHCPIIPGYKISAQLYSGSRTLVYRASREIDQKAVVIKLLTSEYPSFNELLQFRNQYTISKNLNIPGIIHPLSLEAYGNGYILVMEDTEGISLREYIKTTTLSLIEFLAIAIQLANILHDLHQNRVIHKDIKPVNILINPETTEIKLIDFSIASLLPKETQELKNPNVLEGTLAYISPEQTGRMNRGIDYRSDFYSLGVTFYELLTGELPFISDDPMELVHCHIAQQPACVLNLKSEIPQVISEIVNKLMAKNAEDRYQSALGLKRDLENCLYQLKYTGKISYFEIAKRDLWDRFIIPEKLYGRENEVGQLLAAFSRVAGVSPNLEGRAELMLVAGFSGIGKTAVVNEVHKPIAKQRGYFIKGKFDQFNRNIPFSAFVQAFRDLTGQLLSESDAKLSSFKNKILQAVGDSGQAIIDVIPELEQIIGKQPPAPELSGNAAQNRFNILFSKFIDVFAKKEHPLVIFLDDLQWADMASLKLIKLLMSDTYTRYILLIGAYRNNEVSSVHPLMLTLQEIQKAQANINTIILHALAKSDLNNLIADTLNCSLEICHDLAKLVFQKTKGNPFFANQFLKLLYEDRLISFDFDNGYWLCDIAGVKTLSLTDDVVQFMALQLQKLPANTQEVLKLAACIGNYFDLATLAIVSEKSQIEIANYLWKALQEGFVIPTSQVYKLFTDKSVLEQNGIYGSVSCCYKFLHDRVQQAAYCLIPEDQKHLTHLKIGKLLLKNIPAIEREERIFEIVNQLNIGVELINEQFEREQLTQLNLIAAEKAKAATAYSAAVEYLKIGLELLADDCWESRYELTLYLHEIAAETAYLNGDFESMEILGTIVIEKARNILDRVKIYEVQIQMYVAQNQLLAAVTKGIEVLKLLGLELPDSPDQLEIQEAFEKTRSLFAGRDILELINQPLMTEPEQLAILRILSSISPASYTVIPSLYPLVILSQVDLSIQQGNAPSSAFAYASYGLILCGVVQDIESGYKFGRLALNLIEKLNATAVRAKVFLLFSGFISHWQEHLNANLTILQEGYESGLEAGDLEFASYCVFIRFVHEYCIGKELGMLEQEMANYSEVLTKIKQQTALNWHHIYWQSVLNLIGDGENPCRLTGKAYNEDNMLLVHQQAGERSAMFYLYINKLILCYLFLDYPAAVEYAILAEQYLDGVVSHVIVTIFYFYDSLARLALYCDVSNSEQEYIIIRVTENQEKMQKWAHHAPKNNLHKYYLVEAEKNRVICSYVEAVNYYDDAIAYAKENNYIQEEALANELAARFYLNWGKHKVAAGYMQEAYYCYSHWGAKAKIVNLEQHYPQLLAPILQSTYLTITSVATIIPSLMGSVTGKSSSQNLCLDFAQVMKAAQAISQEIELEKLVTTLMQIAITSAGAQIGSLILRQDSEWFVVAQVDKEQTQRLKIPLDKYHDIPQSLIYSVARHGEVTVFENFSDSVTFAGEPYITTHKPKSVLCTPISQQGKLIGILYLENSLTTGVFTKHRLQIIQILTVQAAISLENAQLYRQLEDYSHTLEQKVQQRTEELTEKATQLESTLKELYSSQAQLIQSEKMSSLGQLVAGIAHEINNPVNFIHGNLTYMEGYTKDLLKLLNLYQKHNLNPIQYPESEIKRLLDEIDLDFMKEDLPKILESMKLGTKRIAEIVLSLRNFSRTDEAEFKSVDIHEGINSTLTILRHRLKEKSEYFAIDIIKNYGELPLIKCSPGQLNQVFMNILSNAIDAIEEKNLQQTFEEVKAHPNQVIISTSLIDSNWVEIAIADNGIGMTDEVQKQMFNPFFTTKAVGSGTGMGLSISYQIITKKHAGKLKCLSAPHQGTEFVIQIPICRSHHQ